MTLTTAFALGLIVGLAIGIGFWALALFQVPNGKAPRQAVVLPKGKK